MSNIKIIVERQNGSLENQLTGDLPPRGIIKRKRDDDYLPRRLRSVSGLQFYDLGQSFIDDEFIDNLFEAAANWRLENNFPAFDELSIVDENAKAAQLLNVGTENLKNNYWQMVKIDADKYSINLYFGNTFVDFLTTSDKWSDDGKSLKIDDDLIGFGIEIYGSPFFYNINLTNNDTNKNKVTAVFDFNAPDVPEFAVKKSDTFFLIPAFCVITQKNSGEHYPPTNRPDLVVDNYNSYSFEEELYCNYLTFPRVALDDYIIDWINNVFQYFYLINVYGYTINLDDYIIWYANAEYLKSIASTKFYKRFQAFVENSPSQTGEAIYEEKSVSSYPQSDLYPVPPDIPEGISAAGNEGDKLPVQYSARWVASDPPAGTLLAIIYQNNQFFYVWKR